MKKEIKLQTTIGTKFSDVQINEIQLNILENENKKLKK